MPMCANGLTKAVEELGEFQENAAIILAMRAAARLEQIIGKKLAYFHTDEHPDGAGLMSIRMEAEIADTLAALDFIVEANDWLRSWSIETRRQQKLALFRRWHAEADNNVLGVDRCPPQTNAEQQGETK